MPSSAGRELVQASRTGISDFTSSSCSNFDYPDTAVSSSFSDVVTTKTLSSAGPDDEADFVRSRLFPNRSLGILLKYCFDELEIYYPCIDRVDFYQRLSVLFGQHCLYKGKSTLIPRKPEYLALAALACSMVTIATYLDGPPESDRNIDSRDTYAAAAWEWHLESRRLLEAYAWENHASPDTICIHVFEVLYYTMTERCGAMSIAKTIAVELAFALQLNNEASWPQMTHREREYRRLLWWLIYVLDRRISIRTKHPYLIRNSDVFVGEFTAQSRMHYLADGPFQFQRTPPDMQFDMCRWPLPSNPNEDWFMYWQFNVRCAKIAERVWDHCYSLRMEGAVDVNELDALLFKLESSLPPTLLWNSGVLLDLIQEGKTDRYLRLRLIIFEVYLGKITAVGRE